MVGEIEDTGTTSAYAENTIAARYIVCANRNYLRVRGEYTLQQNCSSMNGELPPRTRRIHCAQDVRVVAGGTTSAYAENTAGPPIMMRRQGNYLRVRGEYPPHRFGGGIFSELPPRTRRIQSDEAEGEGSPGTTSAYAENTVTVPRVTARVRNYLRVRGEYVQSWSGSGVGTELPPRTRRIPHHVGLSGRVVGTTSAYAENTLIPYCVVSGLWNYLRVRGEYMIRSVKK